MLFLQTIQDILYKENGEDFSLSETTECEDQPYRVAQGGRVRRRRDYPYSSKGSRKTGRQSIRIIERYQDAVGSCLQGQLGCHHLSGRSKDIQYPLYACSGSRFQILMPFLCLLVPCKEISHLQICLKVIITIHRIFIHIHLFIWHHHNFQYSFTQGAGKSSGFGFLAKQTIDEPSGRVSFASARKSMTCLGQSCCRQSALLMVISSQKSNRTMNLVTDSKFSLSAQYTGFRLSPFQIMTELLQPSLWFFSHARSPVLKVANSPSQEKSWSRLPVMIMSRSMQNFLPGMETLKSVTFPHHLFHPSYNFSILISGCSPVPSSVKQQKVTFHVVFFRMPAQRMFTQSALYLEPHLTVSIEIWRSSYGIE